MIHYSVIQTLDEYFGESRFVELLVKYTGFHLAVFGEVLAVKFAETTDLSEGYVVVAEPEVDAGGVVDVFTRQNSNLRTGFEALQTHRAGF